MSLRNSVLLLAIPLTAGCFTYAPIQPDQVRPEMKVRASLVDGAQPSHVEGKVFAVEGSSISVLPDVSGGGSTEPVSLTVSSINTIEERTFDRNRTFLLAAVTIGIGIAGVFAAEIIEGGGSGTGGTGDFTLIPVFRFGWSP